MFDKKSPNHVVLMTPRQRRYGLCRPAEVATVSVLSPGLCKSPSAGIPHVVLMVVPPYFGTRAGVAQ